MEWLLCVPDSSDYLKWQKLDLKSCSPLFQLRFAYLKLYFFYPWYFCWLQSTVLGPWAFLEIVSCRWDCGWKVAPYIFFFLNTIKANVSDIDHHHQMHSVAVEREISAGWSKPGGQHLEPNWLQWRCWRCSMNSIKLLTTWTAGHIFVVPCIRAEGWID